MHDLDDFQGIIDRLGAHLRNLSYADLLKLTDTPVETVTVGKRSGSIATIVETMPDESLRVVAQGFLEARFFGQHVALDGFYKLPDGSVMPMPEKEFYEFD